MIYQPPAEIVRYVANYSGSNAMIRRDATHILQAEAAIPVGEDVFCSMRATEAGFRIRSVPQSMVTTEVSQTLPAYLRRQSRWVRTLFQFAIHFRRWDIAARPAIAAAVGTTLLLSPLLAALFGPAVLALSLLGWIWAIPSRRRYHRLLNTREDEAAVSHLSVALQLLVADLVAWATAPWTLLIPRLRDAW